MHRFMIRNARASDLESLFSLAHLLNSVNLPEKKDIIAEALKCSEQSFSGAIKEPLERQYIFVMEDLETKQIVGSSQVIAQHGTKNSPHIFFDVYQIEHYSNTIDKHFKHDVLRMGFDYDGPTEVGGLVVASEYRSNPGHLGKQLSLVRFLWIAMHRSFFRDRVLAELLPPLGADGRSELWEALGRRFTGLSYQQADYASRNNKEFITSLFPQGTIYSTLFTDSARAAIGAVGKGSEPARQMLVSFGFEYQKRVDPFDGGPHFEALTDKIGPVRAMVRAKCNLMRDAALEKDGESVFVGFARSTFSQQAEFAAVQTRIKRLPNGDVEIPQSAATLLKAEPGETVFFVPF